MKIAELREMKTEELHGELDRLRRHLFDLRAQRVTEKLENPNQVGLTRRDIARIFTVLTERGETDIEERQYHLEAIATHRRGG
ncbi:MAG: 50S ribosomal protein L29 [Phycisphaerales bacterium]|jgi:large subunit ribosomal protein L29|nr:MAG: 50S ribosomal protein L29 [Phycisphaerales bacterium]